MHACSKEREVVTRQCFSQGDQIREHPEVPSRKPNRIAQNTLRGPLHAEIDSDCRGQITSMLLEWLSSQPFLTHPLQCHHKLEAE